MRAVAVIPTRDEEATIAAVVSAIPRSVVSEVIVVDNGSRDRTAEHARSADAKVVSEPLAGYGAACLAGIAAARAAGAEIIVLLDGDGSDPAELAGSLCAPIASGQADLVLGVRSADQCEPGALTWQQRFGNALALFLLRHRIGARYTDLPPFKAISRAALDRLDPCDRGYGFTIELLIGAHEHDLRVVEVAVPCRRRRGGVSKVSGTVRGTLGAGVRILSAIARHAHRKRSSPIKVPA